MKKSVVVVGAGPVGIRTVEQISARQPDISISLYGDEPYLPYSRQFLSSYFSGQGEFDRVANPPQVNDLTELKVYTNCAIAGIDTANKIVYRSDGGYEHYDKLVLATGALAVIPRLSNTPLKGLFTLRSIADAEFLRARDCRNVVVLGGGLLGLEIARALRVRGTSKVAVVDHSSLLMSRQLNKAAGDLLLERVLRLGIEVSLASGIKSIDGTDQIESVTLRNGRKIKCDTLIFATGSRPNIALAKQAGIKTRRGIVVDERLLTSAADVFAVGDCAEFERTTYGTLEPGYRQAAIAAANLCGHKKRYRGSITAVRLGFPDYPVVSMGQVGENELHLPHRRLFFEEPLQYIYRYIVVNRWRLIGCIALGEWPELGLVRQAIENRRRIWPWELKRFHLTGRLWS